MLQCVAVCVAVIYDLVFVHFMQYMCDASCCSVLQCVAVRAAVRVAVRVAVLYELLFVHIWSDVRACGAVCCGVLQCAAACCSVLRRVAVFVHVLSDGMFVHYVGIPIDIRIPKTYVSFAEYRLFYRALLHQRPIFLGSLLIIATPCMFVEKHRVWTHDNMCDKKTL